MGRYLYMKYRNMLTGYCWLSATMSPPLLTSELVSGSSFATVPSPHQEWLQRTPAAAQGGENPLQEAPER